MNRRAAIDIGTNSIKLLVGEVEAGGTVIPILETSEQTRLGAGLYDSGQLKPEAIGRTVAGVGRMVELARAHGARRVVAVATSAAREAANGVRLQDAVKEAEGLEVRVLTGHEEADWTFQGVASETRLHEESLLVVDVGGGSTELVLGQGRTIEFRCSVRLGTVRLLEKQAAPDPPREEDWIDCRGVIHQTLEEALSPEVRCRLTEASDASVRLVGAGGTATILARLDRGVEAYDRERLAGTVLHLTRLRAMRERLWSLSVANRRKVKGMPADRADVMLTGVGIYEGILDGLGFAELNISLRGLRFGALINL
jgi:exopolyphosphatase/guanosine-5'-triphosphate,3'-diphosphate pyrophosphatase